jgi:hypothetical protein
MGSNLRTLQKVARPSERFEDVMKACASNTGISSSLSEMHAALRLALFLLANTGTSSSLSELHSALRLALILLANTGTSSSLSEMHSALRFALILTPRQFGPTKGTSSSLSELFPALCLVFGISSSSPPARPDADFRGNPEQLLVFLVHHGKQKGEQALAHWNDLPCIPCIAPLPLEYCCGSSEYCHRQF